ncbi:hypothetical protein Syncc9605_1105 [Synechococcus sp. CC9605]|nr:hypothetical protein Syncc9605_1105 [Synechococcus sp. CC9605]
MRDSSGTSPSDLFQQLGAKWQQWPETPALISRIHTSSCHHAPHQCSDSAEEWIRPAANHPLRRRTAPPARPVAASAPATQTPPKGWADLPDRSIASPEQSISSDSRDSLFPHQKGEVMVHCGEELRSEDPARELNNQISELQARVAYPQHWSSGEHEQHIERLRQLTYEKSRLSDRSGSSPIVRTHH